MSKGTVICLCDKSGVFAAPWVAAGYDAILVDPQHQKGVITEGAVTRVGHEIDHPTTWSILRWAIRTGRVVFVMGFPPCTDVAVSGARWFEEKEKQDKHFQAKAALVAEQCRVIGQLSGARWAFENPVSVFSSIFGKPDYTFDPSDFTLLCPDDNYTKKTCLWASDDFVMPATQKDLSLGAPDDRIHKAPPSPERQNIRSQTPRGFSLAVFAANQPLKG